MADELLMEMLNTLPILYSSENLKAEQVNCPIRLFNRVGPQQWFPTEFDPNERLLFGWSSLGDGFYPELGFTSLDELLSLKKVTISFLLDIDHTWETKTLAEVKNIVG
jgi:hypothetical protein